MLNGYLMNLSLLLSVVRTLDKSVKLREDVGAIAYF